MSTSVPRRRADDEAYTCSECSESFPDVYAFTDHLLRLNGPGRRFACNVCWRTFSHRLYLQKHAAAVHAAQEPKHKCDRCAKSLSSARSVRRHVSMVHGGERPHGPQSSAAAAADPSDSDGPKPAAFCGNAKKKSTCPVCGGAFACGRTLNYHVVNYHLVPNRSVVASAHHGALFA